MEKEIILVSFGDSIVTRPFGEKVMDHLESDFGFTVKMPENREKMRASFLNGELRYQRPGDEIRKGFFKDKPVYIIQDTAVYDNTLYMLARQMQKFLDEEDLPKGRRIANKIMDALSSSLKYGKGPKFGSLEFSPDRLLRKLYASIRLAKNGRASHIGVALRTMSYERSHHFEKTFEKKNIYEEYTLQAMIDEFKIHGANSIINVTAHAHKENKQLTSIRKMNFVNINPLGISQNNGIPINLKTAFSTFKLSKHFTYPHDAYMFDRLAVKGEYDPDTTFIVYPDEGARPAAEASGKRLNLPVIGSLKSRHGEGKSEIHTSHNITKLLHKYKHNNPNANITFLIFDDMANSGKTANDEAKLRKSQVAEYNEKNGTKYQAKVELWVTRFTNPIPKISEPYPTLYVNHLSKIVCLNALPFKPNLAENIEAIGLDYLFRIIPGVSYQIAMGIALDYQNNYLPKLNKKK